MSATRACEPPDAPAAGRSENSAASRAAARWTGPGQPTRTATVPGGPARERTPPPQPARVPAASAPLRLTRRGRVVVAVASALLLAALSLVIASSAQATRHSPAPRTAQQGLAQQGLAQVTVRPGQSLWSVAESADPGADTRQVIQQIIELNSLTGNVVYAGQRLWVPRS